MGGGGGTSKTQSGTDAQYPAEFKPLAQGATNQILRMQGVNPLAQYATANPGGTAGIAPFQQAVMNFAPQALQNSWGTQTLQNMGPAYNNVMANATNIGNTNPYGNVLQALASGGFGSGGPAFPGLQAPPQMAGLGTPLVAPAPINQTVVGPGTGNLVGHLSQQLPDWSYSGQSVAPKYS